MGVVTECPPSSPFVLRHYNTDTIPSTPQPPRDTAQTGKMGDKRILVVSFSMTSEEVRHACMNHYKFSALMSLRHPKNTL